MQYLTGESRNITTDYTTALGLPYRSTILPISFEHSMRLSTVYRCVEVVSDAIASQSWQIKEKRPALGFIINDSHPYFDMLNVEPNAAMTRFIMMKTAMSKVLLEGNAYIVIRRSGSRPVALELVNIPVKMYIRTDSSVYYEVGHEGHTETIQGYDMIHILNYSYNGLMGVSTLTHAATTLGIAQSSEMAAKAFFQNGGVASGVLKVAGKLTKEKAASIKESWYGAFDVEPGNPSGVAVIEDGLSFEPLKINPKDAQMLESREFNVTEICRFFGVAPAKVFDSKNLTYNNIESFQLAFLTDTATPINAKIENEFNRKLILPGQRGTTRLQLNINDLLRANMESKANYVSKMFQCGGYSVNEVREQTEMPLSTAENANKPMVQVNMMPIDKIKDKSNGKGNEEF